MTTDDKVSVLVELPAHLWEALQNYLDLSGRDQDEVCAIAIAHYLLHSKDVVDKDRRSAASVYMGSLLQGAEQNHG